MLPLNYTAAKFHMLLGQGTLLGGCGPMNTPFGRPQLM